VGLALLGAVWAITAFGATAKLLWPERLVRTSYVLYLAQGWAVVAAFNSLLPAVSSRVLVLLVVGGCLYTVGVVFHLWERLRYHNAIWHTFVLAASVGHFAAIVDADGLAHNLRFAFDVEQVVGDLEGGPQAFAEPNERAPARSIGLPEHGAGLA